VRACTECSSSVCDGQQLATFHARVCGSAINTQAMQANYRRRKVVTIIHTLTNASDSKGGSLKGSAFFSLSLVSFTSLVAASKNKPQKNTTFGLFVYEMRHLI